MNESHLRAAVLAAILPDPALHLAMALRNLGTDGAWEALQQGHPSISPRLRERWAHCDPTAWFDRASRAGVHFVVPGDAHWPSALDDLGPQRPWGLWVAGPGLSELGADRPVAIVGARSATHYGERVATQLAHDIAGTGHVVVSGGAYGIDAAAHRGALAAAGVTIAVLANGVDVAYPPGNTALFERIAERGCLVSEAPPGAHPTRQGFLVRNRLIAALAFGTVVVEARQRSGSLSTFAHARHLRRVLMAVPGPVDSAESAGANALLQDDALLVTSGADILGLVDPVAAPPLPDPTLGRREWDELDAAERLVHDTLPARGDIALDGLLAGLAQPLGVGAVLAALSGLVQRGLVAEQVDGRWRRTRTLRGAAA